MLQRALGKAYQLTRRGATHGQPENVPFEKSWLLI